MVAPGAAKALSRQARRRRLSLACAETTHRELRPVLRLCKIEVAKILPKYSELSPNGSDHGPKNPQPKL